MSIMEVTGKEVTNTDLTGTTGSTGTELPDRARSAMLLMDLRRKEALLVAAERRASALDVDAAVGQLRARLGQALADRRRIHDEEVEQVRREAASIVEAARADAETIVARAARPTIERFEPMVREVPTWWPVSAAPDAADSRIRADPPSSDDLLARRARARELLTRNAGPTSPSAAHVDTSPASDAHGDHPVQHEVEEVTVESAADLEFVVDSRNTEHPVESPDVVLLVEEDEQVVAEEVPSECVGPTTDEGAVESESRVETENVTESEGVPESEVEVATGTTVDTYGPGERTDSEWPHGASTPLAALPHGVVVDDRSGSNVVQASTRHEDVALDEDATRSAFRVDDQSKPGAFDEHLDLWRQYGPPAPPVGAVGAFDSETFAAALASALAPLLAANRSVPQQIVLRPASVDKKPAFKSTAGHVDVALALVGLAIALAIFVAWMT